tara:strand:+ start:1168 stop:1557 length:390 start_codon:yes stop_codon:yes gene_type:complete
MKSENTLQKLINFLFGDNFMTKTNSQAVRVPNYTDAMVARMIATYEANPSLDTVAQLSVDMGKNKRSIIAKLVREGVYKAAPRVTKAGAPIVRKADLVSQIETHFGTTMTSLVKASKSDLQRMVDAING